MGEDDKRIKQCELLIARSFEILKETSSYAVWDDYPSTMQLAQRSKKSGSYRMAGR